MKKVIDIKWYYPIAQGVEAVKDLTKFILDDGGKQIIPECGLIGPEHEFSDNLGRFRHKFYNLEGRGTVYLRTEGNCEETELGALIPRVKGICVEVYDTTDNLFNRMKEYVQNPENLRAARREMNFKINIEE